MTAKCLKRVGQNLYRSDLSQTYYAIVKANGKQIRRSLHTTDKAIARRRLDDFRQQVERLNAEHRNSLPFAEYNPAGELVGGLAKRWLDIAGSAVEPSTRDRYAENVRRLSRTFGSMTVGRLDLRQVEAWALARTDCSAGTFNKELEVLRRVLDYGMEHGILLANPARRVKRRKGHKKPIQIPSHDQFKQIVATMWANDAADSADLAELLAYSGCRKSEIVGSRKYQKEPLCWRDIDFRLNVFTVTRSKNHEPRTVPLFPSLRTFLQELLDRRPAAPTPDDRVIPIDSARTAMATASRKLGLPRYGHHTCRHFFCSNAIEALVDFKTIAGWLGQKDGGVLVARTYGHLRDDHSAAMARLMTFTVTEATPDNVIPITAHAG